MTRIHYSERPHARPNYASRTQLARLDSANIANRYARRRQKIQSTPGKMGLQFVPLAISTGDAGMEDAMKTGLAILFAAMFISGVFVTQGAMAADEKQGVKDAAASAKETRWQGHIVRIDKDRSRMSIRGGRAVSDSFERTVTYDSSTEWTKQGKPADQSEFKEGAFVIVVG